MRNLFIPLSLLLAFYACKSGSSSGPASSVPAKPASAAAVKKDITGRKFSTGRTGLASAFTGDSTVNWMDEMKDTSSMFRTFTEGRKNFRLHFVNDTAVQVFDDNKNITATYKTDEPAGEDEKPGIKLRISYLDSANSFGSFGPMLMTYTYIVKGSDGKQLFLETPRSFNNKQVLMLMKAE